MTNDDERVLVAVLQEQHKTLSMQMDRGFGEAKIALSELAFSVKELEKRERDRNGIVKDLIAQRDLNEQRWHEHLAWGAEKATDMGGRLILLEAHHHELDVVATERKRWMSTAMDVTDRLLMRAGPLAAIAVAAWALVTR